MEQMHTAQAARGARVISETTAQALGTVITIVVFGLLSYGIDRVFAAMAAAAP